MKLTILLFLISGFLQAETQSNTPPQTRAIQAGGVTAELSIQGEYLHVRMSADTTGWISIGFDPTRQMADANIIIGYVSDGKLFIADDYGTSRMGHHRDTSRGGTDDIVSASGTESDGGTTIDFSIPLDSGDSMDRPLALGKRYRILLAHGPKGADDFTTYHADRGAVWVDF